MSSKHALLLIDLQNDFCPGGSMGIPQADLLIDKANKLQKHFDLVVATQDWHPLDHASFATNHSDRAVGDVITLEGIPQVLWPIHCVQDSNGAALHARLVTTSIKKIFYKGTDSHIDSYSAFFDNQHLRSTGLGDYLHQQQVTDIYVMGLATDYCVKYSCLDALSLGFNVYLIEDACMGVELNLGDSMQALQEMQIAGVTRVTVPEVISRVKATS